MLLAAPVLQDSIFKKTVILMTEHSRAAGAVGYVVNRPLGKVASDLLQDKLDPCLADVPVFIGGPVGTEHLSFASLDWDHEQSRVVMLPRLKMMEAAHLRAMGRDVRAFVGYSGWSSGQLEKELRQRSWILSKPSLLVMDSDGSSCLWADILADMGAPFTLLANLPEAPQLN